MAKNEKFNEEDGVWRTIGGRRVFIRNGQSLSDAMKESGKFSRVAKNQELYKKVEEEKTNEEYNKDIKDYYDLKSKSKYLPEYEDKLHELMEKYDKSASEINGEANKLEVADAKAKKELTKSDADMLQSIYTYSNEKANVKEDEYYKDLVDKYGQDLVDEKYKELQDKYDIVPNTYTDSEGVTYNSLKEKERTTGQVNKEYEELSKKMQQDDYYYKPEDDRKLKELRAEYDTKVAKGEKDVNASNNGQNANIEKLKNGESKAEASNWQDQIKANNAKLEKDLQAFQEKHKNDMTNEKVQEEYYGMFRKNERANAKIKAEHNEPNDKYMNVDAYAGYKDKFNQTWGEDGSGSKTVSAKMYTNDEFMEHLEDANWHSERKALLDANLTNKELEYIKDRTKVSAWGVENLTGKEQVDKLIKEAKSQSANQSMNNAIREKASKRVAEADIKEKGYEYYSRHGLGPGTLPKDVNTGGTGEMENGWTKFKTDRPLTSEELKKYDIQSETKNSEIKSNNDRMNDAIREKAYKKYLKEHPGSKISFEDYKKMRG